MNNIFNKFGNPRASPPEPDFPPAKRISTPAGQRLSTILEYGNSAATRSKRASNQTSGRLTPLPDFLDEDGGSKNSAYTTTSVWSEGGEKLGMLRNNKYISKRGGWKRLALIVLLIIITIVAIVVGVVVGTKKKSSSKSDSAASSTSSSDSANPTSTSSTTVAQPSNFPVGSYSFVTFLDSVYTDCAQNNATWTCYPYTTYYTSASSSVAVFNWIISAKSGSSKSYQISSTTNPFSISFQNSDLALENAGQDSEHYTFRMNMIKTVKPTSNLTVDNSATTCFFNQTTFQAYLYTKAERTFPTDSVSVTGASYTEWPYRVRVEQVASGGSDVPNCYKITDGNVGEKIQDGLEAQDASNLCSCLYKNWNTPT